jgi:hypothetical protein
MADATVTFAAKDLNLGSTIDKLKKELGSTQAAASNASKGFDMSFGKIGLAAGVAGAAVKIGMMAVESATAAAAAVVAGFGQAIDLGGELTDLSSRTGETAGNLLVLQRAFENTGVNADKVGPSLNKLQKFMAEAAAGGAEQTATLNALGISMSDLAGKTPSEQMQILASKIGSISDPAERARAAMDVFGKSGGELLPLLNNFSGELEGAKGQLGSLPDVMNRSARTLDDLGDNLDAIGSKTMEFAAGFIEAALPALNSFTSALSGIDAAGWGQALMKQVVSVADFLIGAFKAPMPAIEALGAMLMAGVKIGGNALLNSFIMAGEFLGKYLTSDLPFTLIKTLGAAMGYVYTSFAKGLLDVVIGSAKNIEEFFSKAVDSVVRFFTTGFSKFVSAFAQDFKNAMSDPIGFVTGKFKSGMDAVTQGGAGKFQSAFEGASGSVLDKISAGLGATAAGYKEQLVSGVSDLKGGFEKLVSSIEPSAKDFFGAKPAAAEAAEKFKEVESVGTKLREDFLNANSSANATKKNTSAAADEADSVATSFSKAEGSSKAIKAELTQSAKLMKDIADAQGKDSVDKGGKLQEKAQGQIQRGDFAGARTTASRIAANEVVASIRGVGKGRDTRSMADIGKDFGVRQQLGESSADFASRVRDVREGAATVDKFGASKAIPTSGSGVDRPGQDGAKPPEKKPEKSGAATLDTLVGKIKDLLEKIEPRLPVAALTA